MDVCSKLTFHYLNHPFGAATGKGNVSKFFGNFFVLRHTKLHTISSQCEHSVWRVTTNQEAFPQVCLLKTGNYRRRVIVTCIETRFLALHREGGGGGEVKKGAILRTWILQRQTLLGLSPQILVLLSHRKPSKSLPISSTARVHFSSQKVQQSERINYCAWGGFQKAKERQREKKERQRQTLYQAWKRLVCWVFVRRRGRKTLVTSINIKLKTRVVMQGNPSHLKFIPTRRGTLPQMPQERLKLQTWNFLSI